jgi:hypothetical protein
MKTFLTALALATAIAAPAFAQKQAPVTPNAVVVDGKVIGQDPDANVRYDLLKTWQHGID